MLLTIRNVPDELVDEAKRITGKGAGSQAFIHGIELMIQQRQRIEELEQEAARLRERLSVSQQVLRQAHSAAIRLAEVAGQGDMITPHTSSAERTG